METNWYRTNIPEQQEPAGAAAPIPQDNAPKPQKSLTGLKIAVVILSVLLLISASSLFFHRTAPAAADSGFAFSFGREADGTDDGKTDGGSGSGFSFGKNDAPEPDDDGFFDNFEDFFDNYYSSFEESEPCDIPVVAARRGLSIELAEPSYEELSLQTIYSKCSPAIVAIRGFSDADSQSYYSWGTGIIFSSDGYILTNAHVVAGSSSALITLQDNSEYEASLIGCDNRSDIAVLKIDAVGLNAAEFADSSSLHVGDTAIALGNPLGDSFRCTMTNGIISGIDRDISYNGTTLTLIQTNAALNEGNSGGALLNSAGQVIGITNMKMSNTYAGSVTIEGVGFAIPSSTVKAMADSIILNGRVVGRPALGITVGSIPDNAAEHYSLPSGLYVSKVSEGSDCEAQGIRAGDIVTHVNGSPALDTADVTDLIALMEVGDTLTLTVFRDGESFDVTVRLVDVSDIY